MTIAETPENRGASPEELLPNPSTRVRAAFEFIGETRMQGLPFLNAALHVDAIGFRAWQEFWLGIILTPWTMNLLLLPRDERQWPALPKGTRRQYVFPAGVYDFIAARDERLGDYLVCSLFSPVQQFLDHEAARQTALYALKALFDSDTATLPDHDLPPPDTPGLQEKIDEKMQAPLSKRDFLRGRFLRRGGGE